MNLFLPAGRDESLRKAKAAVRWRIRRALALVPHHPPRDPFPEPARVIYLFAGTYGDFVQILPVLRRLAAAYPKADLVLRGGEAYAHEFATEVPRSLRLAKSHEPWTWAFSRADLLLTNSVGVFRGRFDLAARFCARASYGFRHFQEASRGGYSRTLRLESSAASFAEENLRLLDLAMVPEVWGVGPGPGSGMHPPGDAAVSSHPAEPWGRGRILFHIGSAGLKSDFGLSTYAGIITEILNHLEDRKVELLAGPGDGDIVSQVSVSSRMMAQVHSIPRLIRLLRAFEGTVLCFNSFMAHLCYYLGKPAIVIHRGKVPYGYDCSVIHRQVILRQDRGWGIGDILDALGVSQDSSAEAKYL